MAFTQNVEKAARRHLRAAQVLHSQAAPSDQPGCRAVAGYLFGIAGELAIKEIMRNSGMKPSPDLQRRNDPFFAHFPILKTLLSTAIGRRAGELRQLAADPQLFRNWDTTMRYAPTNDINDTWVEAWKESAEELINRMATV
jgi:hypothetical protein